MNDSRLAMSRKKIVYWIAAISLAVGAIGSVPLLKAEKKRTHDFAVNQSMIDIQPFEIRADAIGLQTSAMGSIFVQTNDNESGTLRIVAYIEIDSEDWGGVSFHFPNHLRITNLTSSYPEKGKIDESADYITTLTSADNDQKYKTIIEIGRTHNKMAAGGGKGIVVIELATDRIDLLPESFPISVGVGAYEKDGYDVVSAEHIELSLSF